MSEVCTRDDCNKYPYYGCAPHECYFLKPGGFSNPLGSSTIEPLVEWPANFLAVFAPDATIADQLSWGLCGIYYCPECKAGMGEARTGLMGKDAILAALNAVVAPPRQSTITPR